MSRTATGVVCLAFVLLTGLAPGARAQVADPVGPSLGVAFGFTADPGTFLLAFEAPFEVAERLTVGPLVQLGLSDDWTIVAPTANVRYAFDLSDSSNADVRKLRPFIQGGLGFGYLEKDRRRGDDDDTRFLFNLGGGVEYYLTDNVALGSNMLLNVLPDSAVGENVFFSWQLGSVRFVF